MISYSYRLPTKARTIWNNCQRYTWYCNQWTIVVFITSEMNITNQCLLVYQDLYQLRFQVRVYFPNAIWSYAIEEFRISDEPPCYASLEHIWMLNFIALMVLSEYKLFLYDIYVND